jgi:hypothetical protein
MVLDHTRDFVSVNGLVGDRPTRDHHADAVHDAVGDALLRADLRRLFLAGVGAYLNTAEGCPRAICRASCSHAGSG